MSHFTVMVKIAKNDIDASGDVESVIERLLAPYNENVDETADESYIEFENTEDSMLEEYKTKKVDSVVKDGKFVCIASSGESTNPLSIARDDAKLVLGITSTFPSTEELKAIEERGDAILAGRGFTFEERPFSELYPTFEDFAKQWHGMSKRDADTGKFGYWTNNNAKWDWYQVGGRWAGMLKANSGSRGEKSLLMKEDPYDSDESADIAQIKSIDWDALNKEAAETARAKFDEVSKFINFYKAANGDDKLLSDSLAAAFGEEGKWMVWNMQDLLFSLGLRDMEAEKALPNDKRQMVIRYDEVPATADEFVEKFKFHWEFATYAVVEKDGSWHSKGEMGWWGCSSETADEAKTWGKSFYETFIKNENPETTIAIVDCHI